MPTPEWVDSGATPVDGLDLLGLRFPVQILGNALLDGVTTITPSVRYLSILCWNIQVYGNARRPDSWDDFTNFTARVEEAVAVANMLVDNAVVGIIGATKAIQLAGQENDSIPLERLVSQLATRIYANPSEQLGLTLSRGNSFPALSHERGLVLAETFGRNAKSTRLGDRLSSEIALDFAARSELKEFGEVVAFNRIPDKERTVLIKAILPPEPRPEERPRFQTSRSVGKNSQGGRSVSRGGGAGKLPWCINTDKSLIPLTLLFLHQKRNLLIPLELSRVMHQGSPGLDPGLRPGAWHPVAGRCFPCAYGEPESPTSPPTCPRTGARHKSMTIETARRASLEFVCVFGQDGSGAGFNQIVSGAGGR